MRSIPQLSSYLNFVSRVVTVICALSLAALLAAQTDDPTQVQGLLTQAQSDGSVLVSWDAPAAAEDQAAYSIFFSHDLEEWLPVEEAEFAFEEGRALWLDDGTRTGSLVDPDEPRFYRVEESFPVELARITRRFGEEGDIPIAVRYAAVPDPFVASDEIRARYQARVALSQEQELTHILGHYVARFADDAFRYAIERENSDVPLLVTEGGIALQDLATQLVESNGGELLSVWESEVEGFAAYLPPSAVDLLQEHDLVISIEPDALGTYDEEEPQT